MNSQWTRGVDGILAGVCKALAQRFQVDVMLVRLAWIFSVLFFGMGLGLYLILAVSLPREDRVAKASESRLMGVSARFAKRFDLDVGLTRAGFLFLLFATGGIFFFAYLLMYFILPKTVDLVAKEGSDF